MADYRYSYKGTQDGIAKGVLKDGAISTKVAIEMSNFLRGRNTKTAKAILERILNMEQALPFKRFTDGVGHKAGKGMAAGRYPQKASQAFLDLIKLVENNAQQKGLSEDLVIVHLAAHKASTPYRFGRQSRRKMKRTHVELVLKEDTRKPKAKPLTKAKETPVVKAKTPEVKKVEEKTVEKTPESKVETKPEKKDEPKTETKTETKTEAPKVETKPEEKPASSTPEVVKEGAQ